MEATKSVNVPLVKRSDYSAPDYWFDHTNLEFDLDAVKTRVSSRIAVRRNEDVDSKGNPLVLNGEGLDLISVAIDGRVLSGNAYIESDGLLTIFDVPDMFTLEIVNDVTVEGNTSIMGLCASYDGEIFSQCEAEAFRKIAYYQDRPDVLSRYTVTLRADKAKYPILLSNGNFFEAGDLEDGRHWATWHDPFVKPCYIFALLAGDLKRTTETYRTISGKDVEVSIYASPESIDMCSHSMDFLLKAMKWDEDVFGREYDLDVYNVGILNGGPGAMENKGLNLFDPNWIVADPTNTSDDEYEYRKKTTAHEYFHNWSGDKVTIRNWFQVSLKEGLTRFRDQLFLADVTEFGSVRINMCRHIRNNQFTEDDSPTAHPIIWDAYIEPRNLFTNTVYDKGQECMFMLMWMVGRPRFCEVVAAFFDRYDGTAATIEEFLGCYEEESGIDLSQFRRWFYQAGTTEVSIATEYDEAAGEFHIDLAQETTQTPGERTKQPLHIPLAVALLDHRGQEMPARLAGENGVPQPGTRVIDFTERRQRVTFIGVNERPVLSRHRYFSAPVRIKDDPQDADLAHLVRYDQDIFARWDAGQSYAARVILRDVARLAEGQTPAVDDAFVAAFLSPLDDQRLSPRLRADLLGLPDERTIGEWMDVFDVDGVHEAWAFTAQAVARKGADLLLKAYEQNGGTGPYDLAPETVGKRKLRNVALDYLVRLGEPDMLDLALRQVKDSRNITEQYVALKILCATGSEQKAEAIEIYRDRWKHDQLATDKWYRAQAAAARSDTAARVEELMSADDFNLKLFSRCFSICEQFFYFNHYGVHEPTGEGYRVYAEQMIRVDHVVPLLSNWTVSRSGFSRWRRYDPRRQELIKLAFRTMRDAEGVSKGLIELCDKALAEE
ncbi:aminopeptidase N [Sphingosinicella microcystinivorans]|uniref:Aminopeptidase N n=1 Tax=Sphingosinicella microcystinivorans TaxID=335406 RepID=A0AAD1D401_SPHMI|nr:aminopeptidase N [Sphingosinicella microcystinivorans]RKS85420.1 aminopeptidase N [Sphingosinicella microcystinivorans]BBE33290.1 aminopeptidase N [Sphingosinicella microcystinivorans]